MDIHITVDTEFSAGGYWEDPTLKPVVEDMVWCPVAAENQGLGFMLRVLAQHGLTATFFVETVHTVMLGTDPMKPIIAALLEADQDVQIHAHPMWLAGADGEHPGTTPNDDCAACSAEELDRILAISLASFEAWDAPTPIAFRSGKLSAAPHIYDALHRARIPIASNVGYGHMPAEDRRLQVYNGRTRIRDVVEVPVFSYQAFDPRPSENTRILTTSSTNFSETRALILEAEKAGLDELILLTHPFEFVKFDGNQYENARTNRVIQRRFERLCAWLDAERERFPVRSFAQMAPEWINAPAQRDVALSAPSHASAMRIIENIVTDRFA
ncbi:MAG: hypothetical protein MRY63_12975 [Neomegalonema sp.]|nr:hypothetical protein [Neomegalonema sp.]